MRLIGLDAGTTSVSGVLVHIETGRIEEAITEEHHAVLSSTKPRTYIQDPERIFRTLETIKNELLRSAISNATDGKSENVVGISVTGQVHGILYVDASGRHVSSLYTWQDSRGSQPINAGTPFRAWSDWATRQTGYWIPPGYGFLTHVINEAEDLVPDSATTMTTILGYLSMRLTGIDRPLLDPTDAHSMGVYDLSAGAFDTNALERLGVKKGFVPEVVPSGTIIGKTREGIPVIASVGDNQAGFIGSVRLCSEMLLVSIGTSAQFSAYSPTLPVEREDGASFPNWIGALEIRPYPESGFLIAGASLSGGSSYRLLENFFRQVCRTFGTGDPGSILEKMNSLASTDLDDEQMLNVSTQFLGTRKDPAKRGSIDGITPSNLTPGYLVDGFLRGVVAEVAGFYDDFRNAVKDRGTTIVGIGNALRRNPILREILCNEMGLPILLPVQREEAALGAAIVAGVGTGVFESYTSSDRPIRYEEEDNSR